MPDIEGPYIVTEALTADEALAHLKALVESEEPRPGTTAILAHIAALVADVERLRATPSVMDWARLEGERDEAREELRQYKHADAASIKAAWQEGYRVAMKAWTSIQAIRP